MRANAVLSLLLLVSPSSSLAAELDVNEILDRIDDIWRGESSQAKLSMKVKTENYERTMKLEAWSKGTDQTLIRILEPLKEKGTSTLKSRDTLYTYLPKTDRVIRLTSGMMGGSWMGSHFTNDDLVKESRLRDDFVPEISFQGVRDGKKVLEITLIPREEAAVVWGKIVTTAEESTLLPLETIYYDEDLKIARRATFSEVGKLGGRDAPKVMRMIPADKPEEFTEIRYEELSFGVELKDDFFSVSRLKRR